MGMKRIARLTTLLGILAAVTAGSLAGASTAAVKAPTGVHGFLLLSSEPLTSKFHRTPSFAWAPVSGAVHYELQLATSNTFRDNGILYDGTNLPTPVAAPTLTLPWITGSPHSLYARVRASLLGGHVTPWSAPYGFDMVPPAAPTQLSSYDGLLRWSPVAGADRYQVWFTDAGKIETVTTNVLDEREFYAFHATAPWIGTVHWRVRAMRMNVVGRLNGMPVAAYGPWSPVFHSNNPTPADAPLQLVGTVSNFFSNGTPSSKAHQLMPAYIWTGDETLGGTPAPFFRVEVFTDRACLNNVFTSATVASPAYAPRAGGSLAMPTNDADVADAATAILSDGQETTDVTADLQKIAPTEDATAAKPTTSIGSGSNTLTVIGDPGAPIDLWDVNWPSSGYYWTVIPVQPVPDINGEIHYQDMELPQDVCAAGRVKRVGISSEPSLTANLRPFASGLSSTGRLVTAAQTGSFYGQPLVAWKPAYDATAYEVQWSKSRYPFRPLGARLTFATSIVLPLKPGTWFYRVRGFDYNLPTGAQQMAWSNPTRIVIAKPTFRIVG